MKHIIVGTAGHIDHGKTSLIRAATGIDTDRLKEEKRRGITIELGFAWLDLPGGERIGIVDVPGHEKFVKNMVAGATGIDIVALIIAADEGVMPQTKEHMDICKMLGVQHGLVVLTKTDMVDDEWLDLVTDDVQSFLTGSFLEDAPVVRVSSTTGNGVPEFINVLEALCQKVPSRTSRGLFRLPVDRVFTMKGFGTVITGSLVSGHIRVGENIMVYPSGIESKVRGIQIHNQTMEEASAGVRTAINFQGLDRASVRRGDVLARVGTLKSTYMADVFLEYLGFEKKSLKNRTRVRFYTGTSEIEGYVILLDRDELMAGESTVCQLRLESPVVVVKDDRFVIRSYSPIMTIGGGYIIDPIPKKHKRFKDTIVSHLTHLTNSDAKTLVSYIIEYAGIQGVGFSDLIIMTGMPEKVLEKELGVLMSKREISQVDRDARVYVHGSAFDAMKRETVRILETYHKSYPLKAGMDKEALKAELPKALTLKTFHLVLNDLASSETVTQDKELVRISSHKVALKADQESLQRKIETVYRDSGLQPPYFKDMTVTMGHNSNAVKDVVGHMIEQGILIKVKDDLFFHRDIIADLKGRLVSFLKENQEITTPQLKELTGVSRKYTIPLIEHFDDTKVTIRVGDVRRLREG